MLEHISKLYEKTRTRVVVLIDEYDKPIIDHIDDIETARQNREVLKDFYGVLKYSDQYLRFVFLTGVSKFSKVSIFSGLKHSQISAKNRILFAFQIFLLNFIHNF